MFWGDLQNDISSVWRIFAQILKVFLLCRFFSSILSIFWKLCFTSKRRRKPYFVPRSCNKVRSKRFCSKCNLKKKKKFRDHFEPTQSAHNHAGKRGPYMDPFSLKFENMSKCHFRVEIQVSSESVRNEIWWNSRSSELSGMKKNQLFSWKNIFTWFCYQTVLSEIWGKSVFLPYKLVKKNACQNC